MMVTPSLIPPEMFFRRLMPADFSCSFTIYRDILAANSAEETVAIFHGVHWPSDEHSGPLNFPEVGLLENLVWAT